MATLDSTVGSHRANAYASVSQVDEVIDRRFHTETWDIASVREKERVIMWATRLLDGYRWVGERALSGQALCWPRAYIYSVGASSIPAFLIEATAELAFALLVEDRTEDPAGIGFKNLEIGSLVLEPDALHRRKMIPDVVMNLIRPYLLHDPTSVDHPLNRA